MLQARRRAADVGETVVWQAQLLVLSFMVSLRAVALVVVDQVLTASQMAAISRAVWDILAGACAILKNLLLEAAVAHAFVVVVVNPRRLFRVDALTMFHAHVSRTIVNVLASIVNSEVSRGLALRAECDKPCQRSVG
jgi:hypothetical protein